MSSVLFLVVIGSERNSVSWTPACRKHLLAATVAALKDEIPGLGEVVAFDVKHIYAWVKENNERAYVKDRYDKTRIPAGDPDCKLGVKRRTNQEEPDGSSKEKVESLWGYGSGVAAATTPDYGDVVLAEYTQPFNEGDVTYFRSLYQKAVAALEQFPMHITADAAFDARVGSMTPSLVMGELEPFPRINMGILPSNAILMGFLSALKGCVCIPHSHINILMDIRLNATVVRSCTLNRQARPVTMSNSKKAKVASKTSISNPVVSCVPPWIAPALSLRSSTTSGPLANASIARAKNWESSGLKFATSALCAISTL
jgi:hypothetical protein